MSREDRRRQMDRTTVEAIRARLVRIKIALTTKRVRELQMNAIEAAYLPPPKRKDGGRA